MVDLRLDLESNKPFLQYPVNYDRLLDNIGYVNGSTQAALVRAVNQALTLRNWLVGAYIVEYEQDGEDRAAYGEALVKYPNLLR